MSRPTSSPSAAAPAHSAHATHTARHPWETALRRTTLPALVAAVLVVGALAPLLGGAAPAAAQGFGGPPKASVELVADRTSYPPGAPATVAALVTIEDGWHINSHEPTFPWLIPTTFGVAFVSFVHVDLTHEAISGLPGVTSHQT